MHYSQLDKPLLQSNEKGRLFAPPYGTELREFEIKPDEWEHVCSCRFGEGRLCDFSRNTKWTGDSYRYDLFKRSKGKGDIYPQYALRWYNGGGNGWLVADDLCKRQEESLLAMIATMPDEARRWDACHFLWETAVKTALAATRKIAKEYAEAIVEKRITKRKRKGKYTVEITPRELATVDTK
jgi:acyl-homoserine lactone acylase PvdQ